VAIHEHRRVQRIIEFVGAGSVMDAVCARNRRKRGLVHHHQRPHLVPDGTDFKPGNTVIKSASRRILHQIQPAEPITRIIGPWIIMHAGADERGVGCVEIIKGVRREANSLSCGEDGPVNPS